MFAKRNHRARGRHSATVAAFAVSGLALLGPDQATGAEGAPDALAREYTQEVMPVLREFCHDCHSTAKQKGDLDLERFGSVTEVLRHPKAWQGVIEQVGLGEMPPKDAPKPSQAQRERLLQWIGRSLEEAAKARAGDPGPVVLRRLSNAEYTYTLRDLTGVATLDPAREFPGDSAAGEGFMNVGQAMVMSPALLTKYLDAAKAVASHIVLLPDGLRFSANTTRRDWTEEILGEIRALYARYTRTGGGFAVNLQGIQFDTRDGGVAPLERYFAALIDERTGGTPATYHAGLSARYLDRLRATFAGGAPSVLLDPLRTRWGSASSADAASLAAEVASWQRALWRFNPVGHIGKVGGPRAWMEPVHPLQARQEFRVPVKGESGAREISLYLVVADAGDGTAGDYVVWERPRLVAPGRPDLLLRDLSATNQELAALFGGPPAGVAVEAADLCVRAPSILTIRLPADLAEGSDFVVAGTLHPEAGREGSVQLRVSSTPPGTAAGLVVGAAAAPGTRRVWTDADQPVTHAAPILVLDGSAASARFTAAFEEFRQVFPAALCYTKIVPVDEVVTLTLHHREDEPLRRLMLTEAETATLDRLWDELHYVSQDALTLVDAFEQLWQYATQDADPKVFEPMRAPIQERAAGFRRRLEETQPQHVDAVLAFADRAYRRPLTDTERGNLRDLYRRLRAEELPHDEAIRFTLARVLVAPAFLYRAESPGPGPDPGPVGAHELATRLSYFLWSSAPDAGLRIAADNGTLTDPEVLLAQAHRMLRDPKVRRLATEFACAWLHVYAFNELGEKSERHFPTFTALRGAMYEETIRFFTDFFQHDGRVTGLLDADHTFLNGALAEHYGIPGVTGPEWRRVEGVGRYARGGILGLATVLAKQSGASRTSPILRGNWVSEVLLGDPLPKPPKDVPRLPEDEAGETLTVRALTERHSHDPRCSGCHSRIDPYGFALEEYDAIGRRRDRDLGDRPVDTRVKTLDGAEFTGAAGLRRYVLERRRDAFLRQFCRKLLGYALGRGVLLSDGPLIAEMRAQLQTHDYRVSAALDTVLRSRQFREIRGREADED